MKEDGAEPQRVWVSFCFLVFAVILMPRQRHTEIRQDNQEARHVHSPTRKKVISKV